MKKKTVKKKLSKKISKKALKSSKASKKKSPSKRFRLPKEVVKKKKVMAPAILLRESIIEEVGIPSNSVAVVLPESVVIPAEPGQPMTLVRAGGVGRGVCAIQTSSQCTGSGEQELSIFVVGADREGSLVCSACLQERLDTMKWKVAD